MDRPQITDFLQKGDIVNTQISNSIRWIPNEIVDVNPDTNEINVIFDDRYNNFVIFAGDIIKLSLPDDKVQFFMETSVMSIKMKSEKIMTLKVNSMRKMPNLRKFERYPVDYGANIINFENPQNIFAVITNISLEGLCLHTKQFLGFGEIINISILLPSSSFVIDGEIVGYNEIVNGFEFHVCFVRKDDKTKKELQKLIEDIKEREDRLSHIKRNDRM